MNKPTPYPGVEWIVSTSVTATSTGVPNYHRRAEDTFEEWLRKNAREFPVTLDLPEDISAWIAKIISYWAVVEWIQLGTLARLIGIERAEARVMFGARIGNSTQKIKQLLDMKGLRTTVNLQTLSETLKTCEEARNLLGHGVWMFDPISNQHCIENPSGEWTAHAEPPVSKRKYPQAFYPNGAWFAVTLSDIKTSIQWLQQLDREIDDALLPSRKEGA